MANETLLDEVMSFPSAMLQAGVAGVVASHTVVPDQGAMLLVLRFFDRLRLGIEPACALAEAQVWLSAATNGQIRDAFPAVHPFPDHLPERVRELWEKRCEFSDPHNWAVFSYFGA